MEIKQCYLLFALGLQIPYLCCSGLKIWNSSVIIILAPGSFGFVIQKSKDYGFGIHILYKIFQVSLYQ
jgi:hypothetical protein